MHKHHMRRQVKRSLAAEEKWFIFAVPGRTRTHSSGTYVQVHVLPPEWMDSLLLAEIQIVSVSVPVKSQRHNISMHLCAKIWKNQEARSQIETCICPEEVLKSFKKKKKIPNLNLWVSSTAGSQLNICGVMQAHVQCLSIVSKAWERSWKSVACGFRYTDHHSNLFDLLTPVGDKTRVHYKSIN